MRTLAALFVVAVAIYLQQPSPQPSFAGTWVLESPTGASSDSPTALIVRETVQRKTLRGEPMPAPYMIHLTVERRYASRVVSEDYRVGSAEGRVAWDGNSLVFFDSRHSGPSIASGPHGEHHEVWSLDAQHKLRVSLTEGARSTRTLTYRKQ